MRTPPTAVDIMIEVYEQQKMQGIVLIKRKNEPFKGKWALPGGFQEIGETLEETAVREAFEETGMTINLYTHQFRTYSEPGRDPREHVNAAGFAGRTEGTPKGGDDAAQAKVFAIDSLPLPLAFDHDKRVEEYKTWKKTVQE